MKKIILNYQHPVKLAILFVFISSILNAQGVLPGTPGSTKVESGKKAAVPSKGSIVAISTNYGTIKIKLYDETPKHKENFIKLAKTGYLDSTLFHRVIPGFMIQGGDPNSKNAKPDQMLGSGDIGYKIPAEFVATLYHKRGALAAARDNNPEMQSSGCQFYIVQGKKSTNEELNSLEQRSGKKYSEEQRKTYTTIGGTPFLDHAYTVFGEVIEGMDVVDKITAVPIGNADRPKADVVMKSVKIIQ